jgi:DNA-binding IclR family transcriptional regulator
MPSTLQKAPPRYRIISLQRGLRILSLLAETDSSVSASEIARAAKLHGSTVHRFLFNLEESGYVARDERGNYHLGPHCISLGRAAISRLDVRRASLPALEELNRATRETVHLTVRNGMSAVYVDKFESPEPLRIFSRIGANVPLHCTAIGKVFLAYLPEAEQAETLSRLTFTRYTASTICSVEDMLAELKTVSQQGYAIDNEEHEAHIKCIAGPVWDESGRVSAAFSVTAPATRMQRARLREFGVLVRQTSLSISRTLGYTASVRGRLK